MLEPRMSRLSWLELLMLSASYVASPEGSLAEFLKRGSPLMVGLESKMPGPPFCSTTMNGRQTLPFVTDFSKSGLVTPGPKGPEGVNA